MTALKQLKNDRLTLTGYVFLLASLILFCVPFFSSVSSTDTENIFVINFILTATYFGILWGSGRLRKGRDGLYPLFLFLILFLISAYALNRQLPVFENSVNWFSVLLVIVCTNYVAFAFFDRFPLWLRHSMMFILGIGMVTFIYLAVYLVPLYGIGAVAFFVLGISLHVFAPLLFCIYTIVLIRKKTAGDKNYWFSFAGGITTVMAVVIVFMTEWYGMTTTLNRNFRSAKALGTNGLPGWVTAAQKLPVSWISERVLKADLVYTVPEKDFGNFFSGLPSGDFGEGGKHDPLVMIAVAFCGRPNLSVEDRVQVLEALFDSRHQAQERLWSGESLFTEHVKTAVKIWPELSMSYTEKQLTVTNSAMRRRWGNEEEAIYTFHFPEGAVVSALSLWIEGVEEKGILTTKEKARTAYRTIVGYERRDPSVVHWQEGNTVSVRVFPVMAGESRIFKIGITAPLSLRNDKLVYENVYFDGPSSTSASEDITINFERKPKGFVVPALFSSENGQTYKSVGKYEPNWRIALDAESMQGGTFSFDGKSYSLRPYQKQRAKTVFNAVYLDLNASWTREEFSQVFQLFKDKQVYVFDESLILLNENNKNEIFNKLDENRFSLFPLHVISDPASSLVVTKNNDPSPGLSDLNDSRFYTDLKNFLQAGKKVNLFNIGHGLSPFLKALKEYRVFQYENGDISTLTNLISEGVFSQDVENDHRVVIDNAGFAIVQSEGTAVSTAPDHLMRLFAYNHIMQKMGSRIVTGDSYNEDLVEEARQAYVVSPVSSLVVLETQKDYDRFDITESQNSLRNASLGSKGAVPEPHEWALILVALLVLYSLKFRPAYKRHS